MGKKVWLSMHPRNFGSEKIVRRRPYVRLHVSRGKILHFKYLRVSAENRIATRTFTDKKNNTKADSFFRLNFNVYIDVDNRERARARDKEQKRPIYFVSFQFSNSVSKTRAMFEMFELHASMPSMRPADYQATIPLKFLIIIHNYANV